MKKVKLFVFLLGLVALIGITQHTYAQEAATVNITYKLDGGEVNSQTPSPLNVGDTVNINVPTIEGSFLFWTVNGAVRRDLPQNPIIKATSKLNMVAHYASADKKVVVFLDSNLQLLKVEFLETETPTAPIAPTKPLATNEGWALITDYNTVVTPSLPESGVVYYVAKYSLNTGASPSVTLSVGDHVTASQKTNFNELVTVEAIETLDDKPFSHYVDNEGQILSRQRVYSFLLLSDMTVNAVYATPEPSAVVNLRGPLSLRPDHHTYVGQFELLENQSLIEYGFSFKQDGVVTKVPSNTLNSDVNEFMISFDASKNITDVTTYVTYEENSVVKTITNEVPVVELLKLPAPIHGFNIDPNTFHVGIGPYGEMGGENGGFIGFGFVITNQTTLEKHTYLVEYGYNQGSAFYLNKANLATQGIHLVPGTYKVEYFARGNGTTTSDSDVSSQSKMMTIPLPNLAKPVLSIVGTNLTWSDVEHAESYEVFINDVSKGEQTSPYDLSDLEPGTYTLKVVAQASGYNSSFETKSYVVENEVAPKLDTPTNLAQYGFKLTWDEVENAVGYKITMDGATLESVKNEFDLSLFDKGGSTFVVYVVAKGDVANYADSDAASLSVTLDTLLPRLNAMTAGNQNGDLVTSYGGGYYRLLVHIGHEPFQQADWSGSFKFVLKKDGAILGELVQPNNANAFLHVPNNTNDFYGSRLTHGVEYTLEVSLVAKAGSGHRDSLPWVFNFTYIHG